MVRICDSPGCKYVARYERGDNLQLCVHCTKLYDGLVKMVQENDEKGRSKREVKEGFRHVVPKNLCLRTNV